MSKKKEKLSFGDDGVRRFGDHHEHGRFYEAISHSIDTYKKSMEDGTMQWKEYRHMGADLAHSGEVFLIAIGDDDEKYEELVADMEAVVEEFVVPYDLPFVAPWLEKFVDQQLLGNVRNVLDLARSVLVKIEE